MTQLSVAIVGGLHADARRAAVEALLAGVPGSVALHHDLSTAVDGPDAKVVRTVRDAAGIVSTGETRLVNDCACCALREDLVPELERLADAGLTRLAVVELWDSVEPKAMAEVVAAGGLRLTSVFTAVDPALLLPYLGNGDDLADRGSGRRRHRPTHRRRHLRPPTGVRPDPGRPGRPGLGGGGRGGQGTTGAVAPDGTEGAHRRPRPCP